MDNYELYHYGIKGQRWGIRRFQKKNGSLTPAGKKRQKEKWSDDATEASKIKKKGVKEMSNAELKRLNERVRLEQEYSRLNPSTRKKAIAAVTATAATMGTLLNLYNNSDKLIAKGKPIAQKLIKPISEKLKKEMAIGLWSDIHSDELYHYGVKGMRWGHRKQQYKALKQDRRKIQQSEYKRFRKEYDIDGKQKAAYEYARKNNLDMDDGGGGTQKQGEAYMQMWRDIDRLDTKALSKAKQNTRSILSSKYGEKTVREVEQQDQLKINAILATMLGVPVITLAAIAASERK